MPRQSRATLVTITVALAALLHASPAWGASDLRRVDGGELTLRLPLPEDVSMRGTQGSQVTGSAVTMKVGKGSIDPESGRGSVAIGSGIGFRFEGDVAAIGAVKATFGPTGKLTANVAGRTMTLATLRGGKVGRGGFGAKVAGARLSLTALAAGQLNRALTGSASGPFGAGPLGTATLTTVPVLVEVASGTVGLTLDFGLLADLEERGVNAAAGGISAGAPATADASGLIEFPIQGGTAPVDPRTTRGSGLISAGSITLTKTVPVSEQCDAAHPVGTTMTLSNPFVAFDIVAGSSIGAGITGPGLPGTTVVGVATSPTGFPRGFTANPKTRLIHYPFSPRTLDPFTKYLTAVFGGQADGCSFSNIVRQQFGEVVVDAKAK